MKLGLTKQGIYFDADVKRRTARYTALFQPSTEEIDVDAVSINHARTIAQLAAKRDYQPSLINERIRIIGPRIGLYL